VGWPELRARALAENDPVRTAAATGLAPAEIEALARELAAARAPFIRIGGGPSRHANGAMTVRSIVALAAVLGAPGRDGGCFASSGTAPAIDLSPLTREDLQPGPTRLVNMNRLGWALTELRDPPVKAMVVWCSNPAAVAPDQNAVLRGLAREDLFLAVHERFLTDTARFADVVLPATTSLEHADLYRSYGQFCIQRARPAIAPAGESRSSWSLFRALAAAMRLDEPLFRMSEDEVIDLLLSTPSPWRQEGLAARLAEGKAIELAPPPGPRWRTRSGKIELANAALPEPVPRHLPAYSDAGGPPLRLVTGPAMHTLNSTFMERPELRERNGGMSLRLAPAEAGARGLADGQRVVAWNPLGEATFLLRVDARVPAGVAVAEGVWWIAHAPGGRNVNALTSQRLTDAGNGSTFYDNRIDVRAEAS
jgi:anaerobic selenocysteine-containing dehydrogenase